MNVSNHINNSNTTLLDMLKTIRSEELQHYGFTGFDEYIKDISQDKELSSFPIKKYVNRGSSAIVFETNSGDILKLTQANHFPMNRPQAGFDVPILKKGKCGSVFYYIEPKLYQHGLSEGFVKIIKEMIVKEGYKPSDIADSDIHQIGLSMEGKLYLLDPECAKYKTIFHALYDKLKRIFK